MKNLLLSLICYFWAVSAVSQAAGVLDAHAISERHYMYVPTLDRGQSIWTDIIQNNRNEKLVLSEKQDTIFDRKVSNVVYPYHFGIPYLRLFYEDENWATRVYKTVDLEKANHGIFWKKGVPRHLYTRQSDHISTDTVYNQYKNSIFLETIENAIRKDFLTVYTSIYYDQIFGDDYRPDPAAVDSLADLCAEANKIIIKEDYYYDRYNGKTKSHIVAMGFFKNDQKLFWTYYPELSYVLRNQFLRFNYDLNKQSMTSFDEIFKNHEYEIEELRTAIEPYDNYMWVNFQGGEYETDYWTEMDALFYVQQTKDYVYNKYRNHSGKVSIPVHNGLTLYCDLVNGQIQGQAIYYGSNQKELLRISFKNNIANGPYIMFWESGKIKENGNFEMGLKAGTWQNFFDSGKKKAERIYQSGWMDGEQIFWFENGKKHMSFNYDGFKLNGKYERFNKKGNLMETGEFKNNYIYGMWNINIEIPKVFVEIITKSTEGNWSYPIEAYEDGVLSYQLNLQHGGTGSSCPGPLFECVFITQETEAK